MKGSLVVKNGYYYGIIYYKDEHGVNKQKWVNTKLKERGNKKEAKKILDKEIAIFEEKLNGDLVKEALPKENLIRNGDLYSTMTFIELLEYYLSKKSKLIDGITLRGYYNHLKQIKKYFDGKSIRLCDITTQTLNDYYNHLRSIGISESTIKHYSIIINPALKLAYNSRVIDRNPAEMVEPIRREKYRGEYYDKYDMEKLFESIKGHKIEYEIKIDCYYGFRRSELLGLKWDSIDFDKKTITVKDKVVFYDGKVEVSEKLKTRASYRTLPLIKEVEEMLMKIKERTNQNKIDFGNCYNHEYDDFIFVDDLGMIRRADYVTHEFKKLLEKNNLKHIRFHDLRHSCASLLIANGIPIKQIQEWLGHANFGTTADVYSHLDFSSKKESANTLKDVFTFSAAEDIKIIEEEKIEIDKDLYKEFNEFREWRARKKKQEEAEM